MGSQVLSRKQYAHLRDTINALMDSGAYSKIQDGKLKALFTEVAKLLGDALNGKPNDTLGKKLDDALGMLRQKNDPSLTYYINDIDETLNPGGSTTTNGTTQNNNSPSSYTPKSAASVLKGYMEWLKQHNFGVNGRINLADIDAILARDDVPESLRNVLTYLKNNPSTWATMTGALGSTDGRLGLGELDALISSSSSFTRKDAYAALLKYLLQQGEKGPDGKMLGYSIEKLRLIADDPAASEDLRAAARYLLTHQSDFTAGDTASDGTSDSFISQADLERMLDKESDVEMTSEKASKALIAYIKAHKGEGLTREKLEEIANSTDPAVTKEMKAAARYFLYETGVFDEATGAADGNPDDTIHLEDLVAISLGVLNEDFEYMTEAEVYKALYNKTTWDRLSNAGPLKDGILTRQDLRYILKDEFGEFTDHDKRLALMLLRNPESFDKLENTSNTGLNGGPDGNIAYFDVRMVYEQMNMVDEYDDFTQESVVSKLLKFWDYFAGADGGVDKEDLKRVLQDPNSTREQRGLAQFLLFSTNEFEDADGNTIAGFGYSSGTQGDLLKALDVQSNGSEGETDGMIHKEAILALKDDEQYNRKPMSVKEAVEILKAIVAKYGWTEQSGFLGQNVKKILDRRLIEQIALGHDMGTKEEIQACRLLIANPTVLNAIDTAQDNNGGNHDKGDSHFTINDVDAFLGALEDSPTDWRYDAYAFRENLIYFNKDGTKKPFWNSPYRQPSK